MISCFCPSGGLPDCPKDAPTNRILLGRRKGAETDSREPVGERVILKKRTTRKGFGHLLM